MDMQLPYQSILTQLNPPAETRHVDAAGLERTVALRYNDVVKCRAPSLDKGRILGELQPRFFEKGGFFYEKNGKYYEFLLDTTEIVEGLSGLPIAAWVYSADASKGASRLERIVYLRSEGTLVIHYRDINANNVSAQWQNSRHVSCIEYDKGASKSEIMEAFKEYVEPRIEKLRRQRLLDKLKEELKKKRKFKAASHENESLNSASHIGIKYHNIKPKRV